MGSTPACLWATLYLDLGIDMIFGSSEFENSFHFVAMEYCWLILNRTYLIVVENDSLVGVKVNGPVSAGVGAAGMLAIDGDLQNPYSYLRNSYIDKIQEIDFADDKILKLNSTNFRFRRRDIKSVNYTPHKKWGMAHYPHDGRVFLTTSKGRREFIILGNQSGQDIALNIKNKFGLLWRKI